ncbi:MAG: uncharacterized protein KVP18_003343 [Porospora cf. gigantea A]|uniref:uncharacterized protein n=1 Tax=Porospora cf. gigantea A TaxID=2853593 RepID=UPI00355AC608|nr:MAG: hypothetical protein KVP18_003343 [Porospora cf. gigantea A]
MLGTSVSAQYSSHLDVLEDEKVMKDAVRYLRNYAERHNLTHVGEASKKPELRLDEIKSRLRTKKNRKSYSLPAAPLRTYVRPAHDVDVPERTRQEMEQLKWVYGSKDKSWPLVGGQYHNNVQLKMNSSLYYNNLAIFPYANATRMHGLVGMYRNGSRWWDARVKPMPPTLTRDTPQEEEAMKRGGGFYLELSDALPLDREPVDHRDDVCKRKQYDIRKLDDASVIITFYNEPLSTLLRSIHSVLNYTPPPLLREIILVDDHSSLDVNLPGGPLDEVVKLLPKVKLLRLPNRHGLVAARLAGIKVSRAPVSVILDSHIEVNPGWLEPQLDRLRESPRSVVFPQIPSIDSVDFSYTTDRGIGCQLSFKWMMQEIPDFVHKVDKVDALPSASMAGGLFAVYRDWFYEVGAYDDQMTMWGAENVEMAFRVWMCGGRVECTPCARAYHIYRHKGSGYKSPGGHVMKNRLRTAALWLDEFYQLSAKLLNPRDDPVDLGPFDKMLEVKERLKCKNFAWFKQALGIDKKPAKLSDVVMSGEIRSLSGRKPENCIDTLQNGRNVGSPWGLYPCHGQGGSQSFLSYGDNKIRLSSHENCLGWSMKIESCKNSHADWELVPDKNWIRADGKCLTQLANRELNMSQCKEGEADQLWKWDPLKFDPNYKGIQHSPAYLEERAAWQGSLERQHLDDVAKYNRENGAH